MFFSIDLAWEASWEELLASAPPQGTGMHGWPESIYTHGWPVGFIYNGPHLILL